MFIMLYVVIPPMPVGGTQLPSIFAIANPKGGSGKTTVAIILAGEFAKHGYSAAIVDADPQGSSYQWHASSVARGLSPQGVDLVRAPDETALAQTIDRLDGYDVVVVDTPGYYGDVLIQSALRADLVVLPCKVHTFDASQVVRTIRNLEQHAATSKLPMSQHRVLFNEYDSLDRNTRPLKEVVAYLDAEKVPVCAKALYRRITYRTMTSGHGTLYQMSDKDESIRKARYNADQVVRELLAASQGAGQGGSAA
ncbi:Cobyrinic acid a,c-diamide synthase (plasmid) [Nitrobacter hamburgensis X14]|uniref:Cobyrinic acid a,c-diamide synthase n=1 Tax=Nitrobacter hamburgensis (strain DSM 10229 / NCIMB 13809 / X14) TaxID=323097 RepID=Q1QF92_NITHX|nr:Cobyrinic acid a,c-diamide synthase [Nitrobacter hamburgensis X14]